MGGCPVISASATVPTAAPNRAVNFLFITRLLLQRGVFRRRIFANVTPANPRRELPSFDPYGDDPSGSGRARVWGGRHGACHRPHGRETRSAVDQPRSNRE